MRAWLAPIWLVCAGCRTAPAPMTRAPHAANPAPVPAAVPQPPHAVLASAPALVLPAAAVAPPASEPAVAPPTVVLEPLYSAQGHPRLATEMLTLARDEELLQWALGGSADPTHLSHQA